MTKRRFFLCQENRQTPRRQPILLFAPAEARKVVSSLGRRATKRNSTAPRICHAALRFRILTILPPASVRAKLSHQTGILEDDHRRGDDGTDAEHQRHHGLI